MFHIPIKSMLSFPQFSLSFPGSSASCSHTSSRPGCRYRCSCLFSATRVCFCSELKHETWRAHHLHNWIVLLYTLISGNSFTSHGSERCGEEDQDINASRTNQGSYRWCRRPWAVHGARGKSQGSNSCICFVGYEQILFYLGDITSRWSVLSQGRNPVSSMLIRGMVKNPPLLRGARRS